MAPICWTRNAPLTADQLKTLKRTLGLQSSRSIRYADASRTEDLIVFEVQATNDAATRTVTEKNRADDSLIIVSIAPDNLVEYEMIPLEEAMDGVVTEWM